MTLSTRARAAVVLLATLIGVAATARLGVWQLDRAAAKQALQARLETRRALPSMTVAALLEAAARGDGESQYDRPVHVRGRWVRERTVFLDNRQVGGVPGFYVVTPLQLEGGANVVLVQRGWVQRNFIDRAGVPAVPTPDEVVDVVGRIAPPPSRLYEFAAEASGAIRQNIDVEAYARETGLALLPLSILQSDGPSTTADGLRRQWPVAVLDVQKHYGYAFQWFALCALMAGLYVWFQVVRPRRR